MESFFSLDLATNRLVLLKSGIISSGNNSNPECEYRVCYGLRYILEF